MSKPPKQRKNLKRQWELDREAEFLEQLLTRKKAVDEYNAKLAEYNEWKAKHGPYFAPTLPPRPPDTMIPPPPAPESPVALTDNLKKALALPAAHDPIFKIAHVDLVGKTIEEDLSQSENENLRMNARDSSIKLVSALIKAQNQKNSGGGNQLNVQINTRDIEMPGAPTVKVEGTKDP